MVFQSLETPYNRWIEPERVNQYVKFFGPGVNAEVRQPPGWEKGIGFASARATLVAFSGSPHKKWNRKVFAYRERRRDTMGCLRYVFRIPGWFRAPLLPSACFQPTRASEAMSFFLEVAILL